MNRKAKALGLALVAACAISAIAASSAAATGEKFTSNKEHTILSGSAINNQAWTTTAGSFQCSEVSLDEATMTSGAESAITAKPTYGGCSGVYSGIPNITFRVTMTTCDYKFTSEIPAGKEHAEVHIECTTAGDEIDVEAKFLGVFVQCIKVPAQTPTGGGVTYANSGADHIKIKATVTGVKYTEAGGCGSNTNVNDGTYSGEVTVSGKEPGGNTATLSLATGEKFTSNKEHTILSAWAINNQVFETTAGTFQCTEISFDEATMASGVESAITAKPTYSGCTGVVGGSSVAVRVTMTSCDYKFTSEIPAGKEHSQLHIECTTAGDEIDWEVKVLGIFFQCLKFPAQTPTGGGVTYANSGTDHIKMKFTMAGIKYTEAGACGSNTNVNDGTYSGEVTVSGKEPGGNTATLSYS